MTITRLVSRGIRGLAPFRLRAAETLSRPLASSQPPIARWMSLDKKMKMEVESTEQDGSSLGESHNLVTIMFDVGHQSGELKDALNFFWKHDINLTRIESRPDIRGENYEFYVTFEGEFSSPNVQRLVKDLEKNTKNVQVIGGPEVPWFPRRPKDIDHFSQTTLDAGQELEADHPGFNDPLYRKRRADIVNTAKEYKHGQPIPKVDYTDEEIGAWGEVWDRLYPLSQKYATSEYKAIFPLLMQNCGYARDNIPQLQDISEFLKYCTGFTIRPVAGLLSPRDFFNALAFRVFFSTQYLRHHSRPLYTPEPDIVHELMGHAPMFAIPDFADFSQEIGLASLGATDEQITQLARLYWFTIEFGLSTENGERKALGAGLLSSFGELEYSMDLKEERPTVLNFDPFDVVKRDYPITTYQPIYYQAKSIHDLKLKIKEYLRTMPRSFSTSYDFKTQQVLVDRNLIVKPQESFKS